MPLTKTSNDPAKVDTSDSMKLSPEYLRVGMYVDLNCSWFRHPFPRRSFKLTSQSQINTIKGLGLGTVLVYPRESDPDTDGEETPVEATAEHQSAPENPAQQRQEKTTAEPVSRRMCERSRRRGITIRQRRWRPRPTVKCSGPVRR